MSAESQIRDERSARCPTRRRQPDLDAGHAALSEAWELADPHECGRADQRVGQALSPTFHAKIDEARSYFGVAPDATDEQLRALADRYPVFRIVPAGGGRATTVACNRDTRQPPPRPANPLDRRVGRAVEALSAVGCPLTQYAIRRFGKAGAAVVEVVCLGLLARDAGLIARGTSRFLRPGA